MTNKIFKSTVTVAMVVLMVCLVIVASFIYDYFNKVQTAQLKDELKVIAVQVEKYGESYFEDNVSSIFRITLISPNGNVLYDNMAEIAEMENHAEREEIIEALEHGYGNSERFSSTLMSKSIYEAMLLDDGNILRISSEQNTIGALIVSMLPMIIAMIFMAAILSLILADKMAKRITEPLNTINLDEIVECDVYEELSPMIAKINTQHKQIKKQMQELERKSSEFEQIIECMNEGLTLLDKRGNVISMNPAAMHLYKIKNSAVGRSFYGIDRSAEMKEALNNALKGKDSEIFRSFDGFEYQFDINGIKSDKTIMGAVILSFDITQRALAEKSRREFSANVSHELKTPLQSIIGSAELLENGLVKKEDEQKFVGNIKKEAVRLVSLINDIIRLSQLDENNTEAFEEIDIYEVAKEVVDSLQSSLIPNEITLNLTGSSCIVKGIRGYLYEIIYNLCDNAIRYNVPKGSVDVAIYKEDFVTVLEVKDSGIGIPMEHQSRIFERFYRVDKSHSKQTGGTGLGLSIVKHAAMVMNATIKLESVLGQFTKVTVKF